MLTKSGKNISKVGIGTWGIGGLGHRDMELTKVQGDDKYIKALSYTLKKGINFTEISLGYGHGNAMRLFKTALGKSGMAREDVFITNSLYPRDLPSFDDIKKDVEGFYDVMDTDYADSTLVTHTLVLKFGEKVVYSYLHRLLDDGRTRYVSLSNASPNFIKKFKQEFGNKFFAHEGHVSFEVRVVEDKGVFETCNKLGITNIIWRPLRQNRTSTFKWPLLIKLANKYNKTQNQIILNWIVRKGYYPMVMSVDKRHIDENLSATNFVMSDDDYQQINNFRPPNYNPPAVDWEKNGKGESIVTVTNDFEKHINNYE